MLRSRLLWPCTSGPDAEPDSLRRGALARLGSGHRRRQDAAGAAALVLDLPFPRGRGRSGRGPHADGDRPPLHERLELLGVEHLVLEQGLRHPVQNLAVVAESALGTLVLLGDDALDLGVDLESGGLRVVLVAVELLAQEDLLFLLAVGE